LRKYSELKQYIDKWKTENICSKNVGRYKPVISVSINRKVKWEFVHFLIN